jgi:hypothetical protein
VILAIKIVILVGLVRLLLATENFLLCAGIYSASACAFALLFDYTLGQRVFLCVFALITSTIYFFILSKIESKTPAWFVFMIGGLLIGLV